MSAPFAARRRPRTRAPGTRIPEAVARAKTEAVIMHARGLPWRLSAAIVTFDLRLYSVPSFGPYRHTSASGRRPSPDQYGRKGVSDRRSSPPFGQSRSFRAGGLLGDGRARTRPGRFGLGSRPRCALHHRSARSVVIGTPDSTAVAEQKINQGPAASDGLLVVRAHAPAQVTCGPCTGCSTPTSPPRTTSPAR